jgi:hypothetical protein
MQSRYHILVKRCQHRCYLCITQGTRLNFRYQVVPFSVQHTVTGVYVINLPFEYIAHNTAGSVY